MKKISTRLQLRSQCSICGCDHAVQGGMMVAHGYTLGFGFQNNACNGANAPHYGSAKSPAFLDQVIEQLTEFLAQLPMMIDEENDKRKSLDLRPP